MFEQPPARCPVIAIGHRGAPFIATENTLASLAAALELGADWVEVDAKVTGDDEVIVVHDDTLHRLWALDLTVRECLWPDVRHAVGADTDGIPTLAEAVAFTAARDAVLLIDVANTFIAEACSKLPAVRANPGAVAFTGDPEGLALVRHLMPEATLSLSWEEPTLPNEEILTSVRPQYFNQVSALVDPEMVATFHERGVRVSAYTVDDAEEMTRLVDCGVDAIISNDIGLLREVLDHSTARGHN